MNHFWTRPFVGTCHRCGERREPVTEAHDLANGPGREDFAEKLCEPCAAVELAALCSAKEAVQAELAAAQRECRAAYRDLMGSEGRDDHWAAYMAALDRLLALTGEPALTEEGA